MMRAIRAATGAADRDAIAALINAVELEPITAGMLHDRDQRTPGSERWRVAEDEAARRRDQRVGA